MIFFFFQNFVAEASVSVAVTEEATEVDAESMSYALLLLPSRKRKISKLGEGENMKKLLQGLTVSALVLAGFVVSASAQSSTASTKVKVGFDFMVGNKQLPAGEYRIKAVNNDGSGKLLRVESLDGKVAAIISGIQASNRSGLKADQVKFNKYGDKYFLSTVRFGNETAVQQIARSRSERDAERQTTKTASLEKKNVTIPTTGQ